MAAYRFKKAAYRITIAVAVFFAYDEPVRRKHHKEEIRDVS